MEKLKVKISCKEPFSWYIGDGDDDEIEVTEIETEMTIHELLDKICREAWYVEEYGDESKVYTFFINGECVPPYVFSSPLINMIGTSVCNGLSPIQHT